MRIDKSAALLNALLTLRRELGPARTSVHGELFLTTKRAIDRAYLDSSKPIEVTLRMVLLPIYMEEGISVETLQAVIDAAAQGVPPNDAPTLPGEVEFGKSR